ncbi:MAG: pilus assembly protein [Anaerolineae bacterium]|nr:pilus assembly protein [Anaerolineae bacterium]
MSRLHKAKGQGLVEFALILFPLLMILFAIIEAGFLFQAYLAVQHAAREGARFAVTRKPDRGFTLEQAQAESRGEDPGPCRNPLCSEGPIEWAYRRGDLIRDQTFSQVMGIRVLYSALGLAADHPNYDASYDQDPGWDQRGEPGFFGVKIAGVTDPYRFANPDATNPDCWELGEMIDSPNCNGFEIDHHGIDGFPVKVKVVYNWVPIDPIMEWVMRLIIPEQSAISDEMGQYDKAAGALPLFGEAVMINEGIQSGMSSMAPPEFSDPIIDAPPGGDPGTGGGAAPTSTPTPTPTSTPTATPTNTPTPTSTPTYAYIILDPERDRWPQAEIPNGTVKIFNHDDGRGPYRIYWTDNCGTSTYLGFALTASGGTAQWTMPAPSQISPSFSYLADCGGGIVPERRYSGYLSSRLPGGQIIAQQEIGIFEPRKPPDLVISQIIAPPDVIGGGQFVIEVEVQNTQNAVVTGTFEVDIYVDPSYEPVRKGQQGIGTADGSSPKQWLVGIGPNATKTLSFVIWLPPVGKHTLWAQVDTSDLIDELDDDTNNINGPVELDIPCSDNCDSFNAPALDGKWIYSPVGSASGNGQAVVRDGELYVSGYGNSLWNTYDGRFHMAHQGEFEGDFEMTVRVMEYAERAVGAKTGLMVREALSVGARYVAISVRNDSSGPMIQTFFRGATNGAVDYLCSDNSILPEEQFDGNETNGEGVLLRITRIGDTFTVAYSYDPDVWLSPECMTKTMDDFANPAYPGVFMAPYQVP